MKYILMDNANSSSIETLAAYKEAGFVSEYPTTASEIPSLPIAWTKA